MLDLFCLAILGTVVHKGHPTEIPFAIRRPGTILVEHFPRKLPECPVYCGRVTKIHYTRNHSVWKTVEENYSTEANLCDFSETRTHIGFI